MAAFELPISRAEWEQSEELALPPPLLHPITLQNFLCRQIEQLQKKKGTDDQKSKNVRKADRFKKEIHIMGKFQKNTVAKFSLANLEKSVEDDAINPDSKFV
jgi:hypothetical protein